MYYTLTVLAAVHVHVNARAEVHFSIVVMTTRVMERRKATQVIVITLEIVTSVMANVVSLVVANAVAAVVQKVQSEEVRTCNACQIKNRLFSQNRGCSTGQPRF